MKFEGIDIRDLVVGNTVNGIYILRSAELKLASNKKNYLDLLFSDKTGTVRAKMWDAREQDYSDLKLNKLYYVNAKVDSWQDSPQLTVNVIKLADDEDQKYIDNYVQSAPIKSGDMLQEVYFYTDRIANPEIRSLVRTILKQKEDELLYYPAAKSFHHSIKGGLLYHILRMLRTADALCKVYEGINSDLLFAGVIIHDLAKIGELKSNELGIAEYSGKGQLLGHIIMGVEQLDQAGRSVGASEEVMMLLKHMVVSHHNEADFGSPKKPMFLEAELLHHLDMIDARVYDFQNAVENIEAGQFSEPVFSLDRRKVYKVNLEN
ncbi:MAG: 3'-5' exoribonuclease YhaM family protein [Acetivibrionales bacterium]|jgi:3'-5' exoribonuclease